jgi:hypothetical protein
MRGKAAHHGMTRESCSANISHNSNQHACLPACLPGCSPAQKVCAHDPVVRAIWGQRLLGHQLQLLHSGGTRQQAAGRGKGWISGCGGARTSSCSAVHLAAVL